MPEPTDIYRELPRAGWPDALNDAPAADRTPRWRKPTVAQGVLFALILLSCTVDFSRRLSIAGVSGLGVFTLAAGGMVWAVWLLRPVLPSGLVGVFLPLILFAIDAVGTLLWYRPGMDGVQLLTVGVTFLGVMMLSARESAADPGLPWRLRSLILAASALPVFSWMVLLLSGYVPASEYNLTRAFALYTLTVIGVALASWRGNAWPEFTAGQPSARRRGFAKITAFWPLLWVCFIALVVTLGMSRTALVIIALLIPLSLIYRGNGKSIWRGMLMLIAGAGTFAAVLFSYKPLYDRFFREDASMSVGGVSINSSGRSRIWNLLLTTLKDDWIVGKGVSSSEDVINRYIPNIGQPHNDYLRFYYDQGVLGLSLWFWFVTVFGYRTIGNLRRSIRNQTPDYVQHIAALLALTGVALSMLTDNSYCYAFVMFPLAIVMGSSLGIGWYYAKVEQTSRPMSEAVFSQPFVRGTFQQPHTDPAGI